MTSRRGFTLLEVMVAVVLSTVVALIAVGTVYAAFSLDERLERHREREEVQMIARAFLLDALRHPPEEGGAAINEMLFELGDRSDSRGLPMDEIRFLSQGITPPFGASEIWEVRLAALENGVRLWGAPVGASAFAPIEVWIGGARGLNVRVLFRAGDAEWSDTWDIAGRVPAGVEVVFFTEEGTATSAPLVVLAGLEGFQ